MSEPRPSLPRVIGLRDLILLNIAAVAGIRWLAAAAHTGPGSISLWVGAATFFFVPSALAVSALSRRFPEEGGLYAWTKHGYGDWHGFLSGWCYWLSNLFYFPNLLLAGVGMAFFTFGPDYADLSENRSLVLGCSLVVLWATLLLNIVGLNIGKWIGNVGGLATYAAGGILILIGAIVWLRQGSVTEFHLLPEWSWDKLNFWSQIAFAFGGLELGALMSGEIRNPERTIPRAAWISGLCIAGFYIAGTMAMLVLLPPGGISIMTGLAQAGSAAGAHLGLVWLAPLFALLITLGITGQLGAWIAGSARIPYTIGLDCYLPPSFGKLHPRWKTPYIALLLQGAACTGFLGLMQLGENLRVAYQLLVDMTVITYFIPFVYLFLTAAKYGQRLSGALGLTVTVAAIAFSLVPPADAASPWLFVAKLIGGSLLLIVTGRMGFIKGRNYQLRQASHSPSR